MYESSEKYMNIEQGKIEFIIFFMFKLSFQGCIKFIRSVGEEYQVVKKGRKYRGGRL